MSNFTITKVTAFIAIDPKDGDEGIMAYEGPKGLMMPLICADEDRIKSMAPIAELIARDANCQYRIIQFSIREDVTDQVKEKYLKHQS